MRVKLFEHRPGCRRSFREEALAVDRLREQRLEQLPDHSERELTLEIAVVRGKDSHVPVRGVLAQLSDQAALPNPGRSLDQHESRACTRAHAQQPIKRAQLLLSLQQRGLRKRGDNRTRLRHEVENRRFRRVCGSEQADICPSRSPSALRHGGAIPDVGAAETEFLLVPQGYRA
jgi:hypothetical protein